MKTFAALLVLATAAFASDNPVSYQQVFCLCGQENLDMFQRASAAETTCNSHFGGSGYFSCVAKELGFLSDDCRTADLDALNAAMGADVITGCGGTDHFAATYDPASGWQWPGAFNYNQVDTDFATILPCAKAALINHCHDEAQQHFVCPS